MSIGPAFGIAGGFASASLTQAKGADADRAVQETADQATAIESNKKAEGAAGLGEAEAQEQASDRDADGRRLWEWPGRREDEPPAAEGEVRSKDASGQRGTQLDLSG